MTYELKLERYQGPLEKLIELIEERKLEVSEISLAQVTDDFLRYLETIAKSAEGDEAARMRILADFIAVASRLVFIKSKSLLPGLTLTGEDEADIKDLEERLWRYRAFKPAMKALADLWRAGRREFDRPYLLASLALRRSGPMTTPVFYPSPSLDVPALHAALRGVFEVFTKFVHENETIKEKIVSLEEKVSEVLGRLRQFGETKFRDLANAGSRTELIITFLAILHMAREQLLVLEQESHLSDIIVKKNAHHGA